MIEADRDKTVAVVVGIEKYAYGSKWNLNGPASDAVRFVRWLRQRDIAPERILLFLSPLDENQALTEPLDVTVHPATRDVIQDALAQRLNDDAALAGDLLWVFWGGHGVMEADQKRRLFFANATDQNKLVLDVDSLWQMLRSKDRKRRFKYQVGMLDVCANYFEEMRHKLSLADAGFSAGETDSAVRQLVMYAAAAGEKAKNEDIRRTGAFSEIVLELLEQAAPNAWPPDLIALTEAVKARFEQKRKERSVSQTPVFFQWQDWAGSSGAVGDFRSGYERLSEVSTARAMLADAEITTRELRQLYLRSAPVWQRAPEAGNLDQMLERLWEMMPRDENALPPLFEFVERIAHRTQDQALSEKVFAEVRRRGVTRNQLADLRTLIEREAQQPSDYCHLLIDICDRDLLTKELRFPSELRYWVMTGSNAYGESGVVACENASAAQVREAIRQIIGRVEATYGTPFIELLVHHNWFCCDADEWERPANPLAELFESESGDASRLGDAYHVVLRWGNRAMEAARGSGVEKYTRPAIWQDKVARIRKDQHSSAQPDVFWIGPAQNQRELETKLNGEAEPCAGFSFVPFEPQTFKVKRLLMTALLGGTAFAVWPRRDAPDEAQFRQMLSNAVRSGRLDELPQRIRALRVAALRDPQHPGGALTLFWDDPDRNPLTLATTQPD